MSQKGLSAEELLAKCETREAITRSDVGLDTKQATDGTVYLKPLFSMLIRIGW